MTIYVRGGMSVTITNWTLSPVWLVLNRSLVSGHLGYGAVSVISVGKSTV